MPFNDDFDDRFVSPSAYEEESESEQTLRPRTLAEYVGQQAAKADRKSVV